MQAKYIRRAAVPLALLAAVATGACKSNERAADTGALATDSTLNRDLNLAGADTAAQPQLQDVPSTTGAAPTTSSSTPRTSTRSSSSRSGTSGTSSRSSSSGGTRTTASGNTVTRGGSSGATHTVPAGTTLHLTSNNKVCTNTYKVGQTFSATVSSASGGVPAGSRAEVQIDQVKRSENVNDPVVLKFHVVALVIDGTRYPVQASTQTADITRVRNESKGKDVQKVATGAVIGAIAGQVLGKNTKSTVIGAAAGAAAGTAAAAATANYEGCLNEGSAFTVTLDSPATIRA